MSVMTQLPPLPARTLAGAWAVCDPLEPLMPDDPRWDDLTPLWGKNIAEELLARLRVHWQSDQFAFLALAGHRGSGKSTVVNELVEKVRHEGHLPILVKVQARVNPYDLEFSDLFLVVAEEVEREMRERGRPLPNALLDQVARWFSEVTQFDETATKYSLGIKSGAEAELKLPFFARLFSALTAALQLDSQHKTTIRREIQKYPAALVENTNALIEEARRLLPGSGRITFVFDDTDKYTPDVVDRSLFRQSALLRALHCDKVFGLDTGFVHGPPGESAWAVLGQAPTMLPMMAVHRRHPGARQDDDEAMARLVAAMQRRLSIPDLFSDPERLKDLVRASGGSLSQLMVLIRQAVFATGDKIGEHAVTAATSALRDQLAREIPPAFYPLLARVRLTRRIPSDKDHREILFRRHAYEYDGRGRWGDVNPLIEEIPEFKDALARAEGAADGGAFA